MGELAKRVRGLADLPMESLRCSAAGRHVGFWLNDPTMKKVGGWGRLNSWEVHWRCECGRTKTEVIDRDTGEKLTRSADYGGGVLLDIPEGGYTGGVSHADALAEWLRRVESSHREGG
jgi:hypothetical protein